MRVSVAPAPHSTQNPAVPDGWNALAYARSQMGISLAFHIVFAAAGVALPALMVHRGHRPPAHARSGVPAAVQAAREGDQHPVRGRRGLGDGAVVRARPALAALHGPLRRIDRAAVRAGRVRLLHGGDLPRHLPVRARQGVAAAAPGVGHRRRRQRRRVGVLRDAGERVHERPGGHRSDRRDGQPVLALPGRARLAVLLPGDRLGDGGDPRLHPAARSDADAAPQGAGAGAADGLHHRAGAAAVGGSFGEAPRDRAAAEARRGGGAPAHRRTGGAARRRHPRSRNRRVPRRAADPGRAVVPGVRRLRRDRHRARRVPARRLAAGAGGADARSR